MTHKPPAVDVRHNYSARRFEATIDGHLAVADYVLEEGRIVFTHTFVPPELRGRGIAERLVQAGLAHARTRQLKIVPVCSYVAAYIQRHPEYRDLLAADE